MKKYTKSSQRAICDILTEIMFVKDLDTLSNIFDHYYNVYDLCDDPFTHCPCTPDEYAKLSLEYEKQIMIEKYGHCDGL